MGQQQATGRPKIIACIEACKSKFQDEKYGVGMRVHNEVGNPVKASGRYRCTVCGRTRG